MRTTLRLTACSAWCRCARGGAGTQRGGRASFPPSLTHPPTHTPTMHPPYWRTQELAQGQTLAEMVASGWRADEAEVARIARELLRTLTYLGGRRPPVVHRRAPPPIIPHVALCPSPQPLHSLLALVPCLQRARGAPPIRPLSSTPTTHPTYPSLQGRQARQHCDRGRQDWRQGVLGGLWRRAGSSVGGRQAGEHDRWALRFGCFARMRADSLARRLARRCPRRTPTCTRAPPTHPPTLSQKHTHSLPPWLAVGTYGFMAPEQFRGAATPASDLYGLGGTLLYVLSGWWVM